jgi:hypothetical protein
MADRSRAARRAILRRLMGLRGRSIGLFFLCVVVAWAVLFLASLSTNTALLSLGMWIHALVWILSVPVAAVIQRSHVAEATRIIEQEIGGDPALVGVLAEFACTVDSGNAAGRMLCDLLPAACSRRVRLTDRELRWLCRVIANGGDEAVTCTDSLGVLGNKTVLPALKQLAAGRGAGVDSGIRASARQAVESLTRWLSEQVESDGLLRPTANPVWEDISVLIRPAESAAIPAEHLLRPGNV